MNKSGNNIWCWWCCHPFKTDTLAMPISYDSVTTVFQVYGSFCSFGCMKAYNHNENMSKKSNQYSLISLLMDKAGVSIVSISCAPPRQLLDVFGGQLTIEEFRKSAQDMDVYYLQIPSTITVNHTIEKQSKSNYKWIKSAYDSDNKSFSMKEFEAQASVNKVTNNALKIKPSVKKKQISTLEMVLGLVPNDK